MKNILKKVFTMLVLGATLNSFADWTFDRGVFTMNGDTSISVTALNVPTYGSSNYLQGFGYFLNNYRTFYRITFDNLTQVLNFKDGDQVLFVKTHGMFAYDARAINSDTFAIQTGGGPGWGGPGWGWGQQAFVFQVSDVTPHKMSGQPLPSATITMLFGFVGSAYFLKRRKNK